MKKWLGISVMALLMGLAACEDEDKPIWEEYKPWRLENEKFFEEKGEEKDETTGENVYEKIVPAWDDSSHILRKMFVNGTGRRPYANSRVAMKYYGTLKDGTPFDSSYLSKDSILISRVDSLVQGFSIALQYMQEGDSCEIIIPSVLGYGSEPRISNGKMKIPPYSTLIFGLKLERIVKWERP